VPGSAAAARLFFPLRLVAGTQQASAFLVFSLPIALFAANWQVPESLTANFPSLFSPALVPDCRPIPI